MSAADVARSYVESFASADPDVIAAHVADGFVNEHASALGSACRGRDEYRRRLPGFLASLPGLRYDVEQVIGDGPTVAVPYRVAWPGGVSPNANVDVNRSNSGQLRTCGAWMVSP